MAKIAELFGSANKMDLKRKLMGENVPYRGKKKHGSQMTSKEKKYLFTKLKSMDNWVISGHALDRIKDKGIEVNYEDVVSTIHNAQIIEYHLAKYQGEDDMRVILRGNAIVNREYNAHFVYSLTRGEVVSSWINRVDDNHRTLDWRDYDSSLNILGV